MSQPGIASFDQVDPQDIWRKDRDHFLHPWTHFNSFKKDGSLVMGRGEGAFVHDISGKRYLDGIAGLWCVNMGYGREEIVAAITDQARRLAFFNPFVDTTNVPAAELAARLAGLAPGIAEPCLLHLRRVDGQRHGGAADPVLPEPARQAAEAPSHLAPRIPIMAAPISPARSPASRAIAALICISSSDWVHHVSSPNVYRRPKGMTVAEFCDHLVDELEAKILEIGPENVAAFFAEPVLGAGGVILPPEGYNRRTRELCRRYDILYLADEVVTGFGRLGHMFASQDVFGIEPDLLVCAKGLTSGYQPLGACIFSDEIYEVISAPDPDGWFTNGFTYSGHPVACAAGLATIDLMEREDICGHVRRVGPLLEQRLQGLRDLPIVGDVRGSHFMMCVENVADPATGEPFPEEVNIGKRISDHCERLGLIVRPIGALNIISPPLILGEAEIEALAAILRQGIEATMADLAAEGLWRH